MQLELGDVEVIQDPSADDVRHYLRFMPVESPFVILQRKPECFVQAIFEGDNYRVEYRRGESSWFLKARYEIAVEVFLAFLEDENGVREGWEWKKMTVLNTPGHPAVIILLIVLLVASIVFTVCGEFGLL